MMTMPLLCLFFCLKHVIDWRAIEVELSCSLWSMGSDNGSLGSGDWDCFSLISFTVVATLVNHDLYGANTVLCILHFAFRHINCAEFLLQFS